MKKINYTKIFKFFSFALMKNVDTIYLDVNHYDEKQVLKFEGQSFLENIKNIEIADKFVSGDNSKGAILIENVDANNIYFEVNDNFGGLTIPYFYFINKNHNLVISNYYEILKLKKINILTNENNHIIDLNKVLKIEARVTKERTLQIRVNSKKEQIVYLVDEKGIIDVIKETIIVDQSDVKGNILDLRKFSGYNIIKIDKVFVDTLIIDKNIIKNLSKLGPTGNSVYILLSIKDVLKFKNIKIVDDDSMKLIPYEKEYSIGNFKFVSGKINYVYLIDEYNEIIIYIDEKDNIREFNKKEILKNKDIKDVYFKFVNKSRIYFDYSSNIVFIEYNNGKIKILTFNKCYEIDETFKDFLIINFNKYYNDKNILKDIKKDLWKKVFLSQNFNNDTLNRMFIDYEKYKKWLLELKDVGLSKDAIKYFIDKEFNKFLYPENIDFLRNISNEEIDLFNKLGEVQKKKVLKHSGGNNEEN